MILGLYIDDLIIAASKLGQIIKFKETFSQIFKIKNLGEIRKVLSIYIYRDYVKHVIYLD